MQVAYILSSRRRRLLWPNRTKTIFKGKAWKPQVVNRVQIPSRPQNSFQNIQFWGIYSRIEPCSSESLMRLNSWTSRYARALDCTG